MRDIIIIDNNKNTIMKMSIVCETGVSLLLSDLLNSIREQRLNYTRPTNISSSHLSIE